MEVREVNSEEERIRELQAQVLDNRCEVRWFWPSNIKFVYIHKSRAGEGISKENIIKQSLKLLTKPEYESSGCYREASPGVGEYTYRVFPAVKEGSDIYLIYQEDDENRIDVCTGRIVIRYNIIETKKLFSKKKSAKIVAYTDVPIDREVLFYVKSQGGYALDKGEGMAFPFSRDLHPGKNEFSGIDLEKDESISIVFKDDSLKKTYQLMYM